MPRWSFSEPARYGISSFPCFMDHERCVVMLRDIIYAITCINRTRYSYRRAWAPCGPERNRMR
jgi:hypothetical protein